MSEEIKEIPLKERIEKLLESGWVNEFNYLESQLQEARYLVVILQQKVEQLEKENDDLRRIYQNTYKKYLENGNEEMAHYFMAQIDACPTFYVEPVIDYYKEYYRLENIIKEGLEYVKTHWSTDNPTLFKNNVWHILNKGSESNE